MPKKKLLAETAKVEKVLSKFKTHSITKTNELFYAGAFVVTNKLGVQIDKVAGRKEPKILLRLNIVLEELKQRITAIAAKVRRYQERVDSYRQNRLFENNQRQFYRELDQEEERCDDDQPEPEASKQFWGNIWKQSADHKKDAKWLQDLRSEVNVKKTGEDRHYHRKFEKDTW